MTNKTKIAILLANGQDIKFHFWQGKKQRRLFIDEINGIVYNTYMSNQALANRKLDELMEDLNNDKKL